MGVLHNCNRANKTSLVKKTKDVFCLEQDQAIQLLATVMNTRVIACLLLASVVCLSLMPSSEGAVYIRVNGQKVNLNKAMRGDKGALKLLRGPFGKSVGKIVQSVLIK